MSGAGAAALGELPAQGLAGAVDAHGGVARRDAGRGGVGLHAVAVNLDLPEGLGVLGLEGGGEGADAGAHRSHQLVIGLRRGGQRLAGHRGEARCSTSRRRW